MGLPALQIEDLPHYTYDDYVNWEGRWELIHGIPYAMVPAPRKKHQRISHKIAFQLESLLENCPRCDAYLPVDWQIAEDTVVQPDNLVVCDESIEGEKLEETPVLVFEILSPSTGRKDRVLKYRLYREAGVKYFCIVDPETKSADVFTLKSSEYEKTEDFQDGKVIFDLGPCKIAFDFNEIFTDAS
ncbi:MAG: Uma2 family endonuclease [Candidatus Aminicenantes bacterium]|nr:Uma2 family endonuclease [Candidatus Aminicenantes bacterium]